MLYQKSELKSRVPAFLYLAVGALTLVLFYFFHGASILQGLLSLLVFSYSQVLFYRGGKNITSALVFSLTLFIAFRISSVEVLMPALLFSFPIALIFFFSQMRKPVCKEIKCDVSAEGEVIKEKNLQIDEYKKILSETQEEKEQLRRLLALSNSESKVNEYQRLYTQLKDQHTYVRQELDSARHSSFLEQLRADTLERQVAELDLQLTESSCSDLMQLIKQYSDEYTKLIVSHHRDMVEYELLIQALLQELEKASKG